MLKKRARLNSQRQLGYSSYIEKRSLALINFEDHPGEYLAGEKLGPRKNHSGNDDLLRPKVAQLIVVKDIRLTISTVPKVKNRRYVLEQIKRAACLVSAKGSCALWENQLRKKIEQTD